MRIAVIGKGNIGAALGTKWIAAGHDVVFGVREPAGTGPSGAPLSTVADAIEGAEVVLLAVPGGAAPELVESQAKGLAGKVVIDATNRIGAQHVNSRAAVTEHAPHARYVRAFNTLGWENFLNPPEGADLFFAADPQARTVAEELIGATGLRPALVGGAEASDTVDALLPLWFALVQQHGGNRRLALRVLT